MSTLMRHRSDFSGVVPDEPLLSPKRVLFGMLLWAWFIAIPDQPIYISFWRMVKYHRRPYAVHLWEMRHDNKRTPDAQGAHTNPWAFWTRLRGVSQRLLSHRLHGIVHGSGYQPTRTR